MIRSECIIYYSMVEQGQLSSKAFLDKQRAIAFDMLKAIGKKYYDIFITDDMIDKNSFGKPYLKNESSIYFSISHTSDCVVCGVYQTDLGLDIEKIKKAPYIKVLDRICIDEEKEFVLKSDNVDESFFRIWTLKEAYIKAIGKGLSFPLKKINFYLNNVDKHIESNAGDFYFYQYFLQENRFILSLCLSKSGSIQIMEWESE